MKTFDEIRLENTNKCGYKCFFCPREKMSRNQGSMNLNDFGILLSKIKEHSGQFDLHGFGEPLLDKNLTEKIAISRQKFPVSLIRIYSTLGVKLSDKQILEIVNSGLSELQVSFYGTNIQSYKITHGVNKFDLAKTNLKKIILAKQKSQINTLRIVIRDFPTHAEVKQYGVSSNELTDFKNWLKEIEVDRIQTRILHNYGSGRAYNPSGLENEKPCSVTWGYRKRILQVTWDLNVIPCCFDFNSEIIFGNLKNNSIEEIFNGEKYTRFIEAHEKNELTDYLPCINCEKCFKE